ncbi:serine hydrolase domain-containing protein [Christiangramia crocea]|uniref:Beta-lactamase family protein n=1 Tax=Christiangramia crocea TaxID=2904124 RepID=A0A9X2A6Y2_9FLAO|nr:serine hydrolase domain-containing protein [Gramella crocea]MCG9972495.1 beta-lactamase family protein [Gramella crocea]
MYSRISLLVILFICLGLNAQKKNSVLTEAPPESVGISSERLEKIGNMLQTSVENGEIPGAVALIAKDGKIVFHKAFGDASADGEDLEKNDIFRIASQSKAITATAVMMLWEEGKFRLDDPISNYIPEFKDPQLLASFNEADSTFKTIPADKEITIRHLLTHTSGIGYGAIDGDERFKKIYAKAGITDLFTTKNVTIEESVKKLAKLPLHHKPGKKFTYSEGLDVLGYFIEIVSGKDFDEFLQERIFEPLDMDDTYFYLPASKTERLVQVQHKEGDKWKAFPVTFYDPQYPVKGAKTFFSGGAGLSSTAMDYAKFLQMYLNGGTYNGNRLLSPLTVKMVLSNHTEDLFGGPENFYGLAFGIVSRQGEEKGGQGSEGTFDWGGYFNTQYFADPVTDVIGILLKQTRGPVNDETGWKFRQMVFASMIE